MGTDGESRGTLGWENSVLSHGLIVCDPGLVSYPLIRVIVRDHQKPHPGQQLDGHTNVTLGLSQKAKK